MFIQQGNTGPVGNVDNIINALPPIVPPPVLQPWINGWQLTNSVDAHAFAVALRTTHFPIPNVPGGPVPLQILKLQTNALHIY